MPYAALLTPLGPLSLFEEDNALVALEAGYAEGSAPTAPTLLLRRAVDQLDAYFDGRGRGFDLPLAPQGTALQRQIWAALTTIPYGAVTTYGALAQAAATSPRVIAQACARNPLPIIVPCHRVLPATRRVGGYSFLDGPATKRTLLVLEGTMPAADATKSTPIDAPQDLLP